MCSVKVCRLSWWYIRNQYEATHTTAAGHWCSSTWLVNCVISCVNHWFVALLSNRQSRTWISTSSTESPWPLIWTWSPPSAYQSALKRMNVNIMSLQIYHLTTVSLFPLISTHLQWPQQWIWLRAATNVALHCLAAPRLRRRWRRLFPSGGVRGVVAGRRIALILWPRVEPVEVCTAGGHGKSPRWLVNCLYHVIPPGYWWWWTGKAMNHIYNWIKWISGRIRMILETKSFAEIGKDFFDAARNFRS